MVTAANYHLSQQPDREMEWGEGALSMWKMTKKGGIENKKDLQEKKWKEKREVGRWCGGGDGRLK